MIPRYILDYLDDHGVHARVLDHPKAITAQELAEVLHISGRAVAKTVAFEADGEDWIAVIPANERLDLERLRRAFNAHHVRLLDEREFADLFPGTELGAEPPFGRLYGIPMIVDTCFRDQRFLVVRGGSHEQALLIRTDDLAEMESPAWADIGALRELGASLRREVGESAPQ